MGDVRRLIAFDLDGTLIDSRRDLTDAANALIVERHGQPLPEAAIVDMVGEGARVLVERALASAGLSADERALPRFLEFYDERLVNHTRLYPGLDGVVRLARRHARVAVLTNKPGGPTERILDALNVRGLFDDVIGGDGSYPRKPDPASLFALIERAEATTQTALLIGDSPIDRDTARRAGVRCCITAYGFGFGRFRPGELRADDWVARDAGELAAAVERWVATA